MAANGIVIEQAQILTTHNLATIADLGVDFAWRELAGRSLETALQLVGRIQGNPRPLATVKNAAYAWRQMLFFLSRSAPAEQASFAACAEQRLADQPEHVRTRMSPAVAGLAHVIEGGTFDPDGTAGVGRRLLGWTTRTHWMLGHGTSASDD